MNGKSLKIEHCRAAGQKANKMRSSFYSHPRSLLNSLLPPEPSIHQTLGSYLQPQPGPLPSVFLTGLHHHLHLDVTLIGESSEQAPSSPEPGPPHCLPNSERSPYLSTNFAPSLVCLGRAPGELLPGRASVVLKISLRLHRLQLKYCP